ncbi:MAG: hypothetical protein HOE19_02040 [Candidatus Komeilibacteria bacterium]|jgi:hypothetical protein|nr:hypothetical protein [Candidatus Komeilibacteria bacterium]MBT4447439.1 hypothetical protein [Candidatus Komeilibacteria bacterium]
MNHWTKPRILLSTLMIFIILSILGWYWGYNGAMSYHVELTTDSYFGLAKIQDDSTMTINKGIIGPTMVALLWMLIILISTRVKWRLGIKASLIMTMIALGAMFFWGEHFNHFVAHGAVTFLSFQPLVWTVFWLTMLCLTVPLSYSTDNDKRLLWKFLSSGLLLCLLLGDLTAGWFGHVTNNALLCVLSVILHLAVYACWIASASLVWLGTHAVPIILWLGKVLAWSTLILGGTTILAVIIGMLRGNSPKETARYISGYGNNHH